MYDGIKEIYENLKEPGIRFIVTKGDIVTNIKKWADRSAITFVDKGYLKPQRNWRNSLNEKINVPLVEIATNTVVPIQKVSNKEEYAAYTIRNKINKYVDEELFIWNLPELNNKCNLDHIEPENFTDKDAFFIFIKTK